ncbi:general stress protein [Sporosarcina luteola]|uniref:general stress protein n=1 Tax=Sporosarcina luteola TaxID=582850 RepID=UPI00203E8260|nr:general stress protein [Sporosarcina luteola]MCM3743980.1 general stress protein [Sporosarcina luteola]
MNQKTFVGLYDTETALLVAIEELDEKGIDPENMYVIARNEEEVDMLRRRTAEEIQSAPSNWLDRFIGYISGEDPVRSMLVEVGFDEADLRRYEAEIKQGKWLLYVDGELKKTAYELNAERHKVETNPFARPISEAERLNRQGEESPVGIGEDGLPKNDYRDSLAKDAYEGGSGVSREDLLFGRAGAEVLFDTSEYEPNPPNLSSPSQKRGTPSGERGHLHRVSRRNVDWGGIDQESQNVIPDPQNFAESQMDRQDALAQAKEFADLLEGRNPNGLKSENAAKPIKPIVIDLRNVEVDEEAESWLLKKENQDK